jgi:hypothetical protein
MNGILLIWGCLLSGGPAVAGGTMPPGGTMQSQSGWELKRDRDGVVIYTRESPDSPLKEYRASAVYDCSLKEVYDIAMDLESRPDWVINCTGLEIIDTVDGKIRYHTSYDIPWPMQDRDLVVELEKKEYTPAYAHLLTRSIDLEYPLKKGVVRMPRYREEVFYEKIDEGHTRFRVEGFADPGGSVPAWVVNMFLVDGTYDSVIRTREIIASRGR